MILLSPFVPPSASLILYVLLNSKELFLPVCFINLAFSAFLKKFYRLFEFQGIVYRICFNPNNASSLPVGRMFIYPK